MAFAQGRKLNPALHPRYPKGHPSGGKFMPKGSADYKAAIAAKLKPIIAGIKKNKGKIATELAVVASGAIASKLTGNPVLSTLAGTSARAAIAVGKVVHNSVQKARSEAIGKQGDNFMAIAKSAGLKTISELKSYKFQRKLEKGFAGDVAYAAIANSVGALFKGTPLGKVSVGDAVALADPAKVAKNALRIKQRLVRAVRRSKDGNVASAVESKISKIVDNIGKK